MVPPHQTVHRGVWNVVCLSALNAMDKGRRALFRLNRDWAGAVPDLLCNIATRVARAEFKGLLLDFISLHMYDSHWVDHLAGWANSHMHPFIRVRPGDHDLSLNL
jgi:hypothetical protein